MCSVQCAVFHCSFVVSALYYSVSQCEIHNLTSSWLLIVPHFLLRRGLQHKHAHSVRPSIHSNNDKQANKKQFSLDKALTSITMSQAVALV